MTTTRPVGFRPNDEDQRILAERAREENLNAAPGRLVIRGAVGTAR